MVRTSRRDRGEQYPRAKRQGTWRTREPSSPSGTSPWSRESGARATFREEQCEEDRAAIHLREKRLDYICCCWFDCTKPRGGESFFREAFRSRGFYYTAECLADVSDWVLYGVVAYNGRRVLDLESILPSWVQFVYPVGGERPREFWESATEEFRRNVLKYGR